MIAFLLEGLVWAWMIACALALYETMRSALRGNEWHVWIMLCIYALVLGLSFASFRARN